MDAKLIPVTGDELALTRECLKVEQALNVWLERFFQLKRHNHDERNLLCGISLVNEEKGQQAVDGFRWLTPKE
jgi:hypothetical protein